MTLKGFISIETYVADVYRTSFFCVLLLELIITLVLISLKSLFFWEFLTEYALVSVSKIVFSVLYVHTWH